MRFIVFIIFSFCLSGVAFAQKEAPKKQDKRSNSFEPFTPQTTKSQALDLKKKTTKKKKKSFLQIFNKRMEKKQEDFYDRMEANAKEKKRMARKMQHPKYSDPMYFGHKRKPKKRPPGKRKFCKECKIVH